jgi:hypothetical protein
MFSCFFPLRVNRLKNQWDTNPLILHESFSLFIFSIFLHYFVIYFSYHLCKQISYYVTNVLSTIKVVVDGRHFVVFSYTGSSSGH